MKTLIVFGVLSLLIIIISWRTLFNVKTHGFFRFFASGCMAWLFALNYHSWFINSLSINQIKSWLLLFHSVHLVIADLLLIKMVGQPSPVRDENNLFGFEKVQN